jgi:hypothetical protein
MSTISKVEIFFLDWLQALFKEGILQDMETKPKIHDNIIKHFLSDHKNAISVLRAMLPPQVQEHLELESIRYEKDTFIPKHLKEYYSDLLTSVPLKDQDADAKVYLKYLELTREEEEYEEIKKIAENEINEGEEYMGTIAEMFRREGDERTEQRFIQEKPQWIEHGKLENAQEMLIKSLKLRFEIVKPAVKERIRSIQSVDTVNDLFEISFRCSNMEEFTERLNEVTDN